MRVPAKWPVKHLRIGTKAWHAARSSLHQCGVCLRYWDDGKVTSMTPTPAGRCPFEAFHDDEEEARWSAQRGRRMRE